MNYSKMTRSKLKRKSQHDTTHLYSKEMKQSDNETTPIEFNDMCDDVIDIIMCHLKLEDLANMSDTSKRLKHIASSVFFRRYKNCLISFNAFHQYHGTLNIYYTIKPVIIVSNVNIWFKLIRNFGEHIQILGIHRKGISFNRNINNPKTYIKSALKNLSKYIYEYCPDSLEILELNEYSYVKAMTKRQGFILNDYVLNLSRLLYK